MIFSKFSGNNNFKVIYEAVNKTERKGHVDRVQTERDVKTMDAFPF